MVERNVDLYMTDGGMLLILKLHQVLLICSKKLCTLMSTLISYIIVHNIYILFIYLISYVSKIAPHV